MQDEFDFLQISIKVFNFLLSDFISEILKLNRKCPYIFESSKKNYSYNKSKPFKNWSNTKGKILVFFVL